MLVFWQQKKDWSTHQSFFIQIWAWLLSRILLYMWIFSVLIAGVFRDLLFKFPFKMPQVWKSENNSDFNIWIEDPQTMDFNPSLLIFFFFVTVTILTFLFQVLLDDPQLLLFQQEATRASHEHHRFSLCLFISVLSVSLDPFGCPNVCLEWFITLGSQSALFQF